VLVAIVAVTIHLISIQASTLSFVQSQDPPKGRTDTGLYAAVAERVRHGEGYYMVMSEELQRDGYPTKSVFNWRMPIPLWVIGNLPHPAMGKVLLSLLALVLVGMAFEATAREDEGRVWRALLVAGLLVGPLMSSGMAKVYLLPEVWAGIFMGMSIAAFGLGSWKWGVSLGLVALFFRELALPYCILAMGLAIVGRRRSEVAWWVAGIALWCLYLAFHYYEVQSMMPANPREHQHSWICWSGARFVLATVNINTFLVNLPEWVTALYFMAAMVGFAGWNSPQGIRAGLTAAMFMAAFSIVGQEFNQYWGFLTNPLLCLGVAKSPQSFRDLWRAAKIT